MGDLYILHPGAVPEQPRNAVGAGGRAVAGELVGEAVGEFVDMFDQPGERVAEQLLGRGVGACHTSDITGQVADPQLHPGRQSAPTRD
ncbi:Uncharacterised protein [Mycobacterium tuberculosis]|uniref:Uncharacterized protein n=1 Tax=Mycobacterium tuberculosis TaxID=1773 RepID=A0A655AQG2_MYCTX|nr:Uncharacterised protein [Mycobacterium tuberculosis]CKU18138.1 Uncharacterised protein [Mycobacterium tuberculosis]